MSIGDELLAGDIVNTNASWLAKQLTSHGIKVKKIMTLPDDIDVISEEIHRILADLIVVTGGLGATHDDVTREAIARATGRPIVRNAHALDLMSKYRELSDAQMVMADLPEGAEVLDNPVGVAPGFVVNNILVLPGVPGEMTSIFEVYEQRLVSEGQPVLWLETDIKESRIAGVLRDAQQRFPVKIGSYPRGGKVRIKITASEEMAAKDAWDWLEEQLSHMS